jgi:hypothetical protein
MKVIKTMDPIDSYGGGQTNKYTGTLPDDCSGRCRPILIHFPTQVDLTMVKRWSRQNTLVFFGMCWNNYIGAYLFGSTCHDADFYYYSL